MIRASRSPFLVKAAGVWTIALGTERGLDETKQNTDSVAVLSNRGRRVLQLLDRHP